MRGWKRALELELKKAVNHHMGAGNKPSSSARTTSLLTDDSLLSIPPALYEPDRCLSLSSNARFEHYLALLAFV